MRGFIGSLAVAAFSVAITASPVLAAVQFGPATAGFTFDVQPTYTLTGPGVLTVGSTITTTAVTGALIGVTHGTSTGAITFSLTPGTTVIEPLIGVFKLFDPADNTDSTTFNFNADTVRTTAFTSSEGLDTIQLYLLGNAFGGVGNATPTPTSVILNITGFSGFVLSSSVLANPPDPVPGPPDPTPSSVPEPATLALLGSGLVGLVMARRRRRG